jgi:hypothetical protein
MMSQEMASVSKLALQAAGDALREVVKRDGDGNFIPVSGEQAAAAIQEAKDYLDLAKDFLPQSSTPPNEQRPQ